MLIKLLGRPKIYQRQWYLKINCLLCHRCLPEYELFLELWVASCNSLFFFVGFIFYLCTSISLFLMVTLVQTSIFCSVKHHYHQAVQFSPVHLGTHLLSFPLSISLNGATTVLINLAVKRGGYAHFSLLIGGQNRLFPAFLLVDAQPFLKHLYCLLWMISSHMPKRNNRKCWMSAIVCSLPGFLHQLYQRTARFYDVMLLK